MKAGRVLDWIERTGDRLPDPVFIFVWLMAAMVAASVVAAQLGLQAVHPVTHQLLHAKSLLSADNVRTLLVDMPKTLTSFAPLGYVLLVMLGAGLAERAGLLDCAVRASVRQAPARFLTPVVFLIGLLSNQGADVGFIVLPPLAAAAYAALGRNPVAGVAAAYAAVAASYAGDPLPGQFDALILGISEPAARLIDPHWTANMVGNWFFGAVSAVFYLGLGWFITDKVVEPRLGPWTPTRDHPPRDLPLDAGEVSGLRWAGLAALLVIVLWAALTLVPGAPLLDTKAAGAQKLTPFFRSLPAGFFLLFFAAGLAFGVRTGAIRRDRDIARFCSQGIASMAPYVVLAFVAAHFIAMFAWSNLGAILAIDGAQALKATGLPAPFLMIGVVLLTAFVELFIGSASAKWAAMAPVLVPMMMLLGVSPEMTTAAFRAGDSAMNMGTPLMVYFPIALAYAQRWRPEIGVGGLMACTLPYSAAFICSGVLITGVWAGLHIPPGPAAHVTYSLAQPTTR
jgi:aminobenzoyl-glutamate transport protein